MPDVLPAPPPRPRNAHDLIGRRAELAALRGLLDRGERLITLTGGPGFGKSRLARALTEVVAPEGRWSGGVVSVALRRVPGVDPAAGIGLALGLPSPASADGPGWLGARLRELGPTLLVLDDVDRAIDATRRALPALLDAAPDLTVVAVSREALGLAGEVRFVLGPLPFDAGAGDAPTHDAPRGATGFAEDTAEHLFTIRAEAASPGCSGAPGWREAVRRLARRLDGNPLALECGAARMTVLTPEALLARLDQRFAVLRAPPGYGARGLWEALEEAWEALSPDERRALARLSILEVPAPLAALEAIVGDEPGTPQALELIDGLNRKSLLARAHLGETAAPRLSLFESVGSFASAWLARSPDEANDARERLVRWCVAFVEDHAAATASPQAPAARLALLEERELLLGAARLLSERLDGVGRPGEPVEGRLTGSPSTASRGVGAEPLIQTQRDRTPSSGEARHAQPSWRRSSERRGHRDDPGAGREPVSPAIQSRGSRLAHLDARAAAEAAARILVGLDTVMRRVGAPPWVCDVLRRVAAAPGLSPRLRVLVLITLGTRAVAMASWGEATRAFDDALEVARAAGDLQLEGVACYRRAPLVRALGCAGVEPLVRRGVELLDGGDLVFERAEALASLASVRLEGGDLETPPALYDEAIGIMRREAFVGALAQTLNNTTVLHVLRDDWAAAEGCLREALACAEADGDRVLACVIHQNLAECALRDGGLEVARELLERAREAAREFGYLCILGGTTDSLAQLAFMDGELEAANELAEAAREPLARGWDEPAALGLNRLVRALVAAARGELEVAARASADADAALARVEDPVVARVAAIHRAHLAFLRGEVGGEAARARADAALAEHAAIRARRHEPRFARRLFEATLARRAAAAGPARAGAARRVVAPPPGCFVIAADGAWFADPSGEQVSLARTHTARRVLARLVADLGPEGSRTVDVDDLFAAGWPGGWTPEPHRSNRVYVLIRRLRDAGLAPVLVHDGEGYRLDPAPGLVIAPPAEGFH